MAWWLGDLEIDREMTNMDEERPMMKMAMEEDGKQINHKLLSSFWIYKIISFG